MSGTLSSVDLRKIYLSLKNDPDIIAANSQNNTYYNPLDIAIETYANQQQVGISRSLVDLIAPSPNIQQILSNQTSPIKTYTELTENLPLSFIFYLIDTIHDFGTAANNNAILKDWFVYMITKQLLINFVPSGNYSKYLDINSSQWNAFFITPEKMPKIIINSLNKDYFKNNYQQVANLGLPLNQYWDNSKLTRDINKNITRGFKSQAIYGSVICSESSLQANHWTKSIDSSNISNLFDFRIIAYMNKDAAFKSDLLTSIQQKMVQNQYSGFLCDNGFSSLSWIGGLTKKFKKNSKLMASAFVNSTLSGFSQPLPCILGCPSLYDNMNDQDSDINKYQIFPVQVQGAVLPPPPNIIPPNIPQPPGALDYTLRQKAIFSIQDPVTKYEITRYQWRGTKNYFITKEYHAIFGMEKLTIESANFNVEWYDFQLQQKVSGNKTYLDGKKAKLNKLNKTINSSLSNFGYLIGNSMFITMFGNDWNKFVSEYTLESNAEKRFMMKMKILNMTLDMKRSGDYIQSYAVKFNREHFNKNYIFTTGDVVCANISAYLHDNPTIYALSSSVPNMMQFYNIFKTDANDPWPNTVLSPHFTPTTNTSSKWYNIHITSQNNCGANVENMDKDEINQFRKQVKGGDPRNIKKRDKSSSLSQRSQTVRNATESRRKFILKKLIDIDDIGYLQLLYHKVVNNLSLEIEEGAYIRYLREYFIGKIFSLSTEKILQSYKTFVTLSPESSAESITDHIVFALILFEKERGNILPILHKYPLELLELLDDRLNGLLQGFNPAEDTENNSRLLQVLDSIINENLNSEIDEQHKMEFIIKLLNFYRELYNLIGFSEDAALNDINDITEMINLSKLQTIHYVFSLPLFQQYYDEYLEDLILTRKYTFKDFIFTEETSEGTIKDKIKKE